MDEFEEYRPLSRLFVDFWMGLWICIYGTPIILKTIIGVHSLGFARMGHPIWVITSAIIIFRNLQQLPPWKKIFLPCIGIPIAFVAEIIEDNIYYNHIFMQQPSQDIITNYYIARFAHLFAIIVLPIIVYIYVKIKMRQMNKEAGEQVEVQGEHSDK